VAIPGTATIPASKQDLDSSEILVRAALHRVHADLGEQIGITQSASAVQVVGVLDTAARKQQILDALAGLPHLAVTLSSPDDIPPAELRETPGTPLSVPGIRQPALLASWMEQRYPVVSERRSFADRILLNSSECLRRAYALEALAARYPKLDNPLIAAIAKDHLIAFQEKWSDLSGLVDSPLHFQAGESRDGKDSPGGAGSLLDSMRAFDSALVTLFTGKENASGSADLESTLTDARAHARAIASQLTALLAQF
jgi:hypothetical protein